MLLALDPGHWTGWAILRKDGDEATPVALGQFRYEELPKHLQAISLLSQVFGIRTWLVEDTPDIRPDSTTEEVIHEILSAAQDLRVDVERVKPFHWKYLGKTVRKVEVDHSTDAAKMGMVFLERLWRGEKKPMT